MLHKLLNILPVTSGDTHSSDHHHSSEISTVFSVTTWNCNKQQCNSQWGEELSTLIENHPGFLLLQEVEHTPCFDTLLTRYKAQYIFAPNFLHRNTPRGIATLAPVKATSSSSELSAKLEPFLKTPKVILISTYSIGENEQITLINLHGINFVSSKIFKLQMQQIVEVLQTINHATIIAGDFNSWSNKRNRVIASEILRSTLNFEEVDFTQQKESAKRAPSLLRLFLGSHHLDKILYTPRYLTLHQDSIEILTTSAGIPIISSDHVPLSCKFSLISSEEL